MDLHQASPKTITYSEEIAEGVFMLGFRRDFEFQPGQVIGIGIEDRGPRRLYSISSGNKEELVHILYNVVDQGYLTPLLSGLYEGDTIWVTPPRGEFLYTAEPAFWIAGGTGIAPFYSMLRSGLHENKILLHGERYLERFYFYDAFASSLGEDYIRCCTAEDDPEVFSGRVTDYLKQVSTLPVGHKYYLCGRAEMVVDTRDILISKNVPYNQIISEIYF